MGRKTKGMGTRKVKGTSRVGGKEKGMGRKELKGNPGEGAFMEQ